MKFEFDEAKSQANKIKHGIDFVKAQELWLDDRLATAIAKQQDQEARWIVVGKIDSKYWSAIITHRGDVVRIISVRRSRAQEVVFYENK